MSCSDKIVELLDKLNINGHDKPGGTDKNTNHSYVDVYGNALSKYVTNAGALLEVRKYGAANNTGTISLSCVRASDGGSDAIVLSYTAGILVTYTNAANLTTLDRRYLYVSGVAITGMSGSGASFEVWTR